MNEQNPQPSPPGTYAWLWALFGVGVTVSVGYLGYRHLSSVQEEQMDNLKRQHRLLTELLGARERDDEIRERSSGRRRGRRAA